MRMKKEQKTKLIVGSLVAGAVLACGGVASLNYAKASASETSTAAFYMEEGASVRIVQGSSGIRYKAAVTKSFYDQITTTYSPETYSYRVYTEIAPENDESAVPVVIEHKNGFVFAEDATDASVATVNAALVYDNLSEKTDEEKAQAYDLLLNAQTFIEVLDSENTVTQTYSATVPTGNARSMRSVANAAKVGGNTAAELNDYLGTYSKEESGAELNLFTAQGSVTYSDDFTPTKVFIGAEQVGLISSAEQTVKFACAKDYTTEKYVALFDADGNVRNYKANVVNRAEIDGTNFKDETYGLYAAIKANVDVVLHSDLDMTGVTPSVTNDDTQYSKTFDGNGKTISNLTLSANNNVGGLFYKTNGATVKNLVMEGVKLANSKTNQGNYGILAFANSANDTIENVYIGVAQMKGNYCGLYEQFNSKQLIAKNLVMKYPNKIECGSGCGYLCAFGSGSANLTDCYFFNGAAKDVSVWGKRTSYNGKVDEKSTYTVYNNGDGDMNAYKVNYFAKFGEELGYLKKAVAANLPEDYEVAVIDSTNLKDETNGLHASVVADKNILIAEDLDMTGVANVNRETQDKKAIVYTKIFDGNGSVLSNVSVTENLSGGLFGGFDGKLYNVALTNVTLGDATGDNQNAYGGIAWKNTSSNAYMENVFVQVTSVKARFAGGVYCDAEYNAKLKDVVVIMPDLNDTEHVTYEADQGIPCAVAGFGRTVAVIDKNSKGSVITNGYFVVSNVGDDNKPAIVGTRDKYTMTVNETLSADSSYKAYTTLSDLASDSEASLTDFLKECLNAVNAQA